jgi:FAD:protein FMN transferase
VSTSGGARTATPTIDPPGYRAWVEQIMGMPITVQVRDADVLPGGPLSDAAEAAVQALFADLRDVDARFSTYKPDSELSRLQRGEIGLQDCSPDLVTVEGLCRAALERTRGAFDAWSCTPRRPGLFDPTGLVKSWGVSRAARRLAPLTEAGSSWAVNAGGDVLVRCAPDDGPWTIGIEDPIDRSRILATVPVSDGAVATSGLAARGSHIHNPRTGTAAHEVRAATVVGPSLIWADVWATALVVEAENAVEATEVMHGTSGMIIFSDGRVHRWAHPV